mmetsp:Transcript_23533/g.65318  ORF Transcript_23533/g.65318 Transcript_23533/m.65318 type:complete len:107 (-) Transcript_23533:244-564(-)
MDPHRPSQTLTDPQWISSINSRNRIFNRSVSGIHTFTVKTEFRSMNLIDELIDPTTQRSGCSIELISVGIRSPVTYNGSHDLQLETENCQDIRAHTLNRSELSSHC